ncbi:MAG: T9SS type A sorting domain-containing protein [Chitinophagaceae bacterium]|nr:T9SS type A sorting domain-containing protein [Chitinophagaceae bacterium]
MKTIVPGKHRTGITISLLVAVSMLLSAFKGNASTGYSPSYNDSILVLKTQVSKKTKVKLYPNASHQVLFFSATGEDGKVFQLYLFDLDGKLVKQVNIRNKQTTVLNKIEKGNYVFEVFSNDERIENGQVIFK